MNSKSNFLAAVLLICTAIGPVKAADNSALLAGTWRVTDFSILTVESNEISRPYGDNPVGQIQYSPGGHMIVFLSEGNLPKPASFPYTDAERALIHKGIFGAYAGTYTVEGNKIIHHIAASWRPDWIGTDQIRYFEIDGNKLTIKSAPLTYSLTGKRIVGILTLEKLE